MGRLGFNLVRQKEASKNVNVEVGAVAPDQQQNERNETVEMSELILALEERDRMISTLRCMLLTTTAMVFCVTAYIFLTQSRPVCDVKAAAPADSNMLPDTLAGIAGEYDALQGAKSNELAMSNCTQELIELRLSKDNLERILETERAQHLKALTAANRELLKANNDLETLQAEHKALISQCHKKEEDLQAEVKKLEDERSRAKLARSQRQRPTTTTTTTTTTTPKSTGPFQSEQLKKFNDLVKDIESGSPVFDFQGFMKKADEVFGIQ